jgi:hypothetical protein
MPDHFPENTGGILQYYSDEVVPALAVALTLDDKFPEEVLNEIRSSFTHIARAHSIDVTDPDHLKELESASRHLKRVCLDCLKVSILALAQRCDTAITALTEEVQLPEDVYRFVSELQRDRARITCHEGQKPTHAAVEELKDLLVRYEHFYQNLDDQFAGQTADMRRAARRRGRWKSIAIGFVLGVVGSLVATAISNFYFWT